jgi:flagellar hook-associated protein 3 FlgL
MRISNSLIANTIVARLARASERLFRRQEQVASGLAFTTPSQNPSGAVRAVALRSGLAELSRYRDNCSEAAPRLSLTEAALSNISASLREAYTIGLAMTPYDQPANDALADQIHQIAEAIVRDANAAPEGRYLFAGHETLTPPLIENPAGIPPYLYQGDRGDIAFRLARNVTIVANLDAAEVLNFDGAVDPARTDALETLRQLEVALRAGDFEAAQTALGTVQWHLNGVVALRGTTGALIQHVQLADHRLEHSVNTLQGILSGIQDVDIAQAVTDLRSQEIAYQAAAAAASTLHHAALLDYL